jgi:hypothetical protein
MVHRKHDAGDVTMKSVRRNFLKATGTLCGLATGALTGLGTFNPSHATGAELRPNAIESTVSPEIEGTWLITVVLDIPDVSPFPALVSYSRGGAMASSDSGPGPAAGNIYFGTWVRTKAHTYAFTFLGFQFDAKGALSNYIRGQETLQVESDGRSYKGVTKIEILDKDMMVVQSSNGTSLGKRITAI